MQLLKSSKAKFLKQHRKSVWAGIVCAGFATAILACGGGQYTPPPVNLSVSLSNGTVTMSAGSSVSVPVVVMAPTETVTFTINSLPAGVTQSYKESESNPSGLLTLTASSLTKPGTYQPTIVVGASGQTASLVFTLVITAMEARNEPVSAWSHLGQVSGQLDSHQHMDDLTAR